MIKKVLIICVALTLVTVLVGVAGSISTQTLSNPSTASAATVKSPTTTTTTEHPIFLSYEQPTSLQLQSYTGPFVGSINSNVYHYPWCSDAKKILPKNLVTFATVADACAAGYRACKVCDPPACGSPTPTPTAVPSASTVATPTPTIMPTSTIAPTSTPAKASPSTTLKPAAASTSTANVAQASVAASSSASTPGFEGLYALGALAAVFLALRVTRRH